MFDLASLEAARGAVTPLVKRTPLLPSPELADLLGCRVSLKLESFQATGSFKPRGTFYQALGLTPEQRERGVVGFSGGNFARAVGYVGGELGLDTVVVMPEAAPLSSVEATRRHGAAVELVPTVGDAIARVRELEEAGRVGLHPFDHPRMVAGNASLGFEIAEDAPDATHVFISIGGGGFITGVGSALKHLISGVELIGVETELAATMHASLAAGAVVDYVPTSRAATLGAPYVSQDALAFAQEHLESVDLVTDQEAFAALEVLADSAKIVVELAASATLAAARKRIWEPDDHVVLVICGGNISLTEVEDLRRDLG